MNMIKRTKTNQYLFQPAFEFIHYNKDLFQIFPKGDRRSRQFKLPSQKTRILSRNNVHKSSA